LNLRKLKSTSEPLMRRPSAGVPELLPQIPKGLTAGIKPPGVVVVDEGEAADIVDAPELGPVVVCSKLVEDAGRLTRGGNVQMDTGS
jgi:hypothetical protein